MDKNTAQAAKTAANTELDVAFCRGHFPALGGDWVFLENAGGTLVPDQVIARLKQFTSDCQVQPGEGYPASDRGAARIAEGQAALAALINAEPGEIVIGPSTTGNVYVLSHALRPLLAPGDEIVVTNQDHEANNGAWRRLEATGIVLREWRMNAETEDLEIEDLLPLLGDKTKLVCFNHCSNIAGMFRDVKEIAAHVHEAGALVCVDGVAAVPHRRVDVKALDVDFYLYSPYKVFGPHLGVLYGRRDLLALLANQSHYFLAEDDHQRRLCPGGYNYELTAAAGGIAEYLDRVHAHHFPGANLETQARLDQVFELFAEHERKMAQRIEDYLNARADLRLVARGAAGRRERIGVFAFTVEGRDSGEIATRLKAGKIGLHADDFYAARCIDALGLRERGGVLRASLVHYNDAADVDRLLGQLEETLSS
ncbi:MAG: aminotransferase class V-fold PLP-dependent enzyme [Proteobacteria bacterium]|nr:aminotransferase class V-fold PLP-dependent enzyme [Pseudomonadota bacterium]